MNKTEPNKNGYVTSARLRDSYAYRLYQNAHPATKSNEPRMYVMHTQ